MADHRRSRLRVMPIWYVAFREQVLDQVADALLPAPENPWLAPPLARKLRLQAQAMTVGMPPNAVMVAVSRDLRMGAQDHREGSMRLLMILIW